MATCSGARWRLSTSVPNMAGAIASPSPTSRATRIPSRARCASGSDAAQGLRPAGPPAGFSLFFVGFATPHCGSDETGRDAATLEDQQHQRATGMLLIFQCRRISPWMVYASPLKLATVTRWPQPYSAPKSINATGLQNRFPWAIDNSLLLVVPGPTMFVFIAFQIPLTSKVDRRLSVHQCWYQIQPPYELGDWVETNRS